MMIYDLDTRVAADVWDSIRGWMAEAMSYHPVMDEIDLYHIIMAGRAQVVVVIVQGKVRGAAVMESVEYPSKRVANVIALGGERGFLYDYLPALVDHLAGWSKAHGCDTMMAHGRLVWARHLKRFGAVPVSQTVTCLMDMNAAAQRH